MANVIRRYRLEKGGLDDTRISDEVGTTIVTTDDAGGLIVEKQVDNAVANYATNLDESMADRGFTFVSESPADTADEAFGGGIDHSDLSGLTTGDAGHTQFLLLSGGTMTGDINLNSNRITNVPDIPTANSDAVNANYVESVVNKRDPKEGCRLRATVDLVGGASWIPAGGPGVGKTLTSPNNLVGNNDFDSVTAVVGDRILVMLPTSGANAVHNGIYTVTQLADGASQPTILTRATDFDTDAEVTQGAYTVVAEGTLNQGTSWQLVTQDPITVDVTQQTWTQITAPDSIVAGAGLDRAVNTLSVDLDTTADAQGAGSGGGSSGLEFDAAGNSGKLRVKVNPAGGIQRGASGLEAELDPAGAIVVGANGLAAQVDGTTIQINGSNQLEVIAGAVGSCVLHWGNDRVSASTTTRYLTPGYGETTARTTNPVQWRAPRAGTMQNLYIRHGVTGGNGNNIVYTLRVNGVATALTVTLASTAANGQDTVNTVTIAAGDLIDIEVTKGASTGGQVRNVTAALEFTS